MSAGHSTYIGYSQNATGSRNTFVGIRLAEGNYVHIYSVYNGTVLADYNTGERFYDGQVEPVNITLLKGIHAVIGLKGKEFATVRISDNMQSLSYSVSGIPRGSITSASHYWNTYEGDNDDFSYTLV